MSIASAFVEYETSAPETPPESHPVSVPVPRETSTPVSASCQRTVLNLPVQGAPVADAMRHVGYSSAAFYKACSRHPEFRVATARARNDYRAQVTEEFHNAEACARMLVDTVMRDEALPASLRLHAALAILNRKGDRWLPMSIPAPEEAVDTMDTVDNVDNIGGIFTSDNMDALDTANPDYTEETMDNADTMDTVDTPSAVDRAHPMDTVDTLDNPDALDTVGTLDSLDSIDTTGTVEVVDTVDTVDTVDNLRTSRSVARNGRCGIRKPHRIVRDSGGPLAPRLDLASHRAPNLAISLLT